MGNIINLYPQFMFQELSNCVKDRKLRHRSDVNSYDALIEYYF